MINVKKGFDLTKPFILYSVCVRYRIAKDAEGGGDEGEDDKECGYDAKSDKRRFRCVATHLLAIKEPRFKDIRRGGTNKENCDIQPIGRLSNSAVIGVKKRGN